jgi:hypothetical protein
MSRLVAIMMLLASSAALAASWETPSFRTANGELVRVGMTRAEVVKSAGPPLDKSVLAHGLAVDGQTGLTREAWTYRTADGTYTLTFTGTRLEKIEVTPAR